MSENIINYTSTIAEIPNGIILASYKKKDRIQESYQSEYDLEQNLIKDLIAQGYQRLEDSSDEGLRNNLRKQIERLNEVSFTNSEWDRFLFEYLDSPNDGIVEKTDKVQRNYQYDFKFDSGVFKNIKIIDKKNVNNNILQVVNQIKRSGKHKNIYDVSILVNGLPLVHIELKKRGVNLQEAFNQIHRYSKESFDGLYNYVQIYVISNGTNTRYFANTTAKDKNNYVFTCEWADFKNKTIKDLEDFTATFFAKKTLLEIITKYCVFNSNNELLIMRPYQIAATERIIWKIISSYNSKKYGTIEGGGFIWHTTGSGKTLTSFKTAKLATELEHIDKVFFVVDRKDLDYQTIREYEHFQKGSVNGSNSTKELERNISKKDDKIIVTTIQKLNEFMKKHPNHEIYSKHCVLIFDECHRSQFGQAQKKLKRLFKKYYQFGFTGTPIFEENSISGETTTGVFGNQIHSYIITDAIRDAKVLKFKVDYNNVSPEFKDAEKEQNEINLKKLEAKMFIHPDRISKITKHILDVFDAKTHRNELFTVRDKRINGFNSMFAVQSIESAKLYYEEFEKQQKDISDDKKLKIATIYSFAQNEEQSSQGEITDENFEPSALNQSSKEFLERVIRDYNLMFKTNYSIDSKSFQDYYKDLSKRVKNKEIDILIVVGMFLTGFDAPTLNTLFVDKNLRYHGLIQAYSRTNRTFNKVKAFGNIVCFRDLEQATKDAISTFGDKNSINVILEKSYLEYLNGFTDEETGQVVTGYKNLCQEMLEKFPDLTEIQTDKDKKEFVELFGEILKAENILKNYDEFQNFEKIISERLMQDMRSVYADIRESVIKGGTGKEKENKVDFSDIEFQIELLKTDEINLDYILALILEKSKDYENVDEMKSEIRRVIKSNLGTRAKESLIMDFIDNSNFKSLQKIKKEDILEQFYTFAKKRKEESIKKVIEEENLNKEEATRFITNSISIGEFSKSVTVDNILPSNISRRQGARQQKKEEVLLKINELIETFIGI